MRQLIKMFRYYKLRGQKKGQALLFSSLTALLCTRVGYHTIGAPSSSPNSVGSIAELLCLRNIFFTFETHQLGDQKTEKNTAFTKILIRKTPKQVRKKLLI